jgi:hypothetical protein
MTLPAIVIAAVVAAATSVHIPVSTNEPAAQAAMDRGLFLYYAYDGDDAARSFEDAATRDPRLAMAYWGLALAHGPDLNTALTQPQFEAAQHAIRRAAALAPGAPKHERELVAILTLRYAGPFADWQRDDAAYREAMLAFANSSHDENAQLLAAEALLEHGGLLWHDARPASDESRTAFDLVSEVLSGDARNPMANHLCVHLYDYAPDRRAALPCAQRLDAAAFPMQAEHLAHMPAHYWIEVGNYSAALSSSDRAYALISRLEGTSDGAQHAQAYETHDVAVGYSAAAMLGNYSVARTWARRMEVAYNTSFDAFTALRFGRYADAYAAPGSQFGGPSVRGLAALRLGRVSEVRAIQSRLSAGGATHGYIPQLFLARASEVDGKIPDVRRWIAQALNNQQDAFGAELIPLLPAGEALGFFELRRGAYSAAVAAFAQTLALYPHDPRALYGLATALAGDGQAAAATKARARFEAEWKGADTRLIGADFP